LSLRAGDWVEVLSADEILGTLDEEQSLEGLPFMPEMLQYCGKKFRVHKTAHKTCDTVRNYTIRSMTGVVHLEGLRCDGQSHAGCQAGCLLYWKEAWLRRTREEGAVETRAPLAAEDAKQRAILIQGTQAPSKNGDGQLFRCQATDLLAFTREVRRRDRWNPLFYLKDLTSRNVGLGDFIGYGLLAILNAFMDRWFRRRYPRICGGVSKVTLSTPLNLRPGDLVQVKSKEEIMQTLGANMKNRGLHFDVEMVTFCENGTHRVLRRVERIIDEKTGRLIDLPNPCLILEGVTCSGLLSSTRMFCPRSIYPYWREVWLKRVHAPETQE
jgi:hypothetical protein